MPDAGQDLKSHSTTSIKHAREALKHYDEALKHANESLGRTRNRMMDGGEGSGSSHEKDSSHSHEEGSH